ncbi:MAG: 50S ribosomal protein L11 methyltransferase [Gammaproteobacteria bacterium]|nr:50S ribosomal protein L11 methyltransferase [Gammaproteobacteria bacterium]
MPWLQLIFEADPTQITQLSDLLPELGAVAVTLEDNADQPLFEPPLGTHPLWENTRVVGLFEASADMDLVVELLKPPFNDQLPPHRTEILEDQNWEQAWMERFKPMPMGKRLWICPSWCKPPEPDAINVLLDPGLAFGTGTHPTTALCLEWLDGADLQGKMLVDYGCGSGILAVAACLLGCEKVWAVDNDPQALTSCRDNAEKNGVSHLLHVASPETFADQFQGHTNIIVANILAGPLQQLAPTLSSLLEPNGHLVLSGILNVQEDAVRQAYLPEVIFAPCSQRDEWISLDGQKIN